MTKITTLDQDHTHRKTVSRPSQGKILSGDLTSLALAVLQYIPNYPRFVFDGPNILLKFHVDRVYTLEDIAIFIFGQFCLKLPIHAPFG